MRWVKNILKNWRENSRLRAEADAEPIEKEDDDPCIKEPIRAFVRTVKAHPKRFKCKPTGRKNSKLVSYKWYDRAAMPSYLVTDLQLGIEFEITYVSGRLFDVLGVDFQVNGWEMVYLDKHLRPIFYREDVIARKQRLDSFIAQRKRKALEEEDQARRDKWKELYS